MSAERIITAATVTSGEKANTWAASSDLIKMEMQVAMTIFAVNLKRIIRLISEK